MSDRWWSDYASLFVAALEFEDPVYEIDRRWWERHEVFHVLDADDSRIMAALENMVANGDLQPYAEDGRFEVFN